MSQRRALGSPHLAACTPTPPLTLPCCRRRPQVSLLPDAKLPLVALAFKLEESRFGQLTYMRLYQGTMRRGDYFYNVDKKEKIKVRGPPGGGGRGAAFQCAGVVTVHANNRLSDATALHAIPTQIPRLVRMHSNNMEDIEAAGAGEILATFGVECSTGHSFTDGTRTFVELRLACNAHARQYCGPHLPRVHLRSYSGGCGGIDCVTGSVLRERRL